MRPIDSDRLAFHRLVFARRRSGWWTPLAVGGLGIVFYLALIALGTGIALLFALADDRVGRALLSATDSAGVLDVTSPLSLLLGLGAIALLLPAYLLASLIVNGRRVGFVTAVYGRMRWRWLLVCGALAVVAAIVATLVANLFPAEGSSPTAEPQENPALWASLAVVLLIVPFQAAAEEYIFRGYLMQAIGRWLRHPAFAIVLPVPLFVLGHLYDPVGQAGVAVFALAAGWLTWRTGGLEAAIAVHVVNNLLAFLLGLAGLTDVAATEVGWSSLAVTVLLFGLYCLAVEAVLRRRPIVRTYGMPRRPLPPVVPMPVPTATIPLPGEKAPDITRP